MTTKTKAKSTNKTMRVELVQPSANLPASIGTGQQIVSVIERAISNPKLDVKKMQAIIDMQIQMLKYQAEVDYNNAMCDCQAEIPQVETNCENKQTHSKYADLSAIDTVIKPIYIKHGFSINFTTKTLDNGNKLVTACVRHRAGHKEYHDLDASVDTSGPQGKANKTDVQGTVSTTSYMQRVHTKLIFNVVIKGEDKDGNADKQAKPEDEFSAMVKGEGKTIDNEIDVALFKKDLTRLKTKVERCKHITDNINVIQALAAQGKEDVIQELHALADKGR